MIPRLITSVFVLAIVAPCSLPASEPLGAWRDLSLPDAIANAKQEELPALVYVSVPHCLACVRMERTTLADPALIEWLDNNCIAIRIDATMSPELAEALGVRGYPTVIRLDDGDETARVMGYQSATDLLAWLESPDAPVADITGVGAPLGDVHDHAMDLIFSGSQPPDRVAAALCEFWIRAAVEPDATPTLRWLRRDRYPSLLKRAASEPAGRAVIERLAEGYDEHGPPVGADPIAAESWVVLMLALSNTTTLDRWIEHHLQSEQGRRLLSHSEMIFEHLAGLGRWRDAGAVASERAWSRWIARLEQRPTDDPISDAAPPNIIENERLRAPEILSRYARALDAAGRKDESAAIRSALE